MYPYIPPVCPMHTGATSTSESTLNAMSRWIQGAHRLKHNNTVVTLFMLLLHHSPVLCSLPMLHMSSCILVDTTCLFCCYRWEIPLFIYEGLPAQTTVFWAELYSNYRNKPDILLFHPVQPGMLYSVPSNQQLYGFQLCTHKLNMWDLGICSSCSPIALITIEYVCSVIKDVEPCLEWVIDIV